jgi:hypothetical protein
MGRRHRCPRERTRTRSGVCFGVKNIRAVSAHLLIDGKTSQRLVTGAGRQRPDELLRPASSAPGTLRR